MIARLILTTSVALGVIGLARCADMTPEEQVRDVARAIIDADNARNLERVLALYAEDAVLFPPNESPIRGKSAIRPRYEALFKNFRPEIRTAIGEVRISGDMAYVIGTNAGRMVSASGGPDRVLNDDYVMILRRSAQGAWRIERLMWHPGAPPARP